MPQVYNIGIRRPTLPKFFEGSKLRSLKDSDSVGRQWQKNKPVAEQVMHLTEIVKQLQWQMNRLKLRRGGEDGSGGAGVMALVNELFTEPYSGGVNHFHNYFTVKRWDGAVQGADDEVPGQPVPTGDAFYVAKSWASRCVDGYKTLTVEYSYRYSDDNHRVSHDVRNGTPDENQVMTPLFSMNEPIFIIPVNYSGVNTPGDNPTDIKWTELGTEREWTWPLVIGNLPIVT